MYGVDESIAADKLWFGVSEIVLEVVSDEDHLTDVNDQTPSISAIEGESKMVGHKTRAVIASEGETAIRWARSILISCSVTPA